LKPDPHPDSKLHRTLPVADPKTHDKVRKHKGDDRFLANSPSTSPAGGLISAVAPGFMPRTSIYALPNNRGLYHTAPTTKAATAATTTAR
jgi:hypothetical protein